MGRSHQLLGEIALNTIASEVFGLPLTSMRDAFNHPIHRSEYGQRNAFHDAYRRMPPLASFVQEHSSGGNGVDHHGMMADIWSIIAPFQDKIDAVKFEKNIVPYFGAHIGLEKNAQGKWAHAFRADEVEYQHGQRAEADAREYLDSPEKLSEASEIAKIMQDGQAKLFDTLGKEVFEPDCSLGKKSLGKQLVENLSASAQSV